MNYTDEAGMRALTPTLPQGPGCPLCKGTGVADLSSPWGGVTGTCPDCHGTGNAGVNERQAPSCVHHWRDFGSLGGRNVVWCSKCDALAFTGHEDGVAVPRGGERSEGQSE